MRSLQSNTEYDCTTTTVQMGFRRKSNYLFESVSQEFTLLIYVLLDFSLTVKAAPRECEIRTSQP